MLEIDRGPGNEGAAPSAAQAQLARDAAKAALEETQRERERLPVLHREAVSRGDFESARRYKDALSLIEDRAAFATQQLSAAELALLAAELADAEMALRGAGDEVTLAFAQEEQAARAHREATAQRSGAQARAQSYQLRAEELRRQHAEARRRLERESP